MPRLEREGHVVIGLDPLPANTTRVVGSVVDARLVHQVIKEIYAQLGWSMVESIDRVYDASHAARRLGFKCRTGFQEKLDELALDAGLA